MIARPHVQARAEALYADDLDRVHRAGDRMFAWLMAIQWIAGVAIAFTVSPYSWAGSASSVHVHVYLAVFVGGMISVPPIVLAFERPGSTITRHTAAASQMFWSALLIHLTGGRIETHFHVFGSLAFLAFYRDWKVLATGIVVVVVDHLLRGVFWASSVYGILNPEWWRFLEHAFWVAFESIVLVTGTLETLRRMRAHAAREAELQELHASVGHEVEVRTAELHASREQYRRLVEEARAVPWEIDIETRASSYVGPQIARLLGCDRDAWRAPDFWAARIHPDDRAAARGVYQLDPTVTGDREIEFRLRHDDGRWIWVRAIGAADEDHRTVRGLLLDVTERRKLEIELRQAQKLESVGRLAAGIAHEINTPVQFVSDNIHFTRDAVTVLVRVIAAYEAVGDAVEAGRDPAPAVADARGAAAAADVPYLLANMPPALDSAIDGLGRIATIVRAMKEFAHPDHNTMAAVDLNQSITSTLTIARNEYKYVADLETDFAELPAVTCHAGEINQVVLNLVVNAAHAIEERMEVNGARGAIEVATRRDGDDVVISVRDTGGGIPEAIRHQIFDPFFTTKEVGRGTGQGLAIARSVVHDKHGGELWFETELGAGTTFYIRLPITGRASSSGAAAA